LEQPLLENYESVLPESNLHEEVDHVENIWS
jgi:hypothetical protein